MSQYFVAIDFGDYSATYQNSGPRRWKVAEINMVIQIGTQFGVAIQQAELLAQTQRQAEELQKAKSVADAANTYWVRVG